MRWYTGDPTYDTALTIAFAIVAITVVLALFVKTPYGRFADEKFGALAFVYFYTRGPHALAPFPLFVLFVWLVHYGNRGFLMPALMRVPKGQKSSFGLLVVAIGWVVTSLHGYLNGAFASTFSGRIGWEWFAAPSVVIGVLLYYAGFAINLHSDHILRKLRTKEEVRRGIKEYRIPRGGLFEYVSNPSYFSELLFWMGFAVFTWSLAGVFILAISMANLVPRAIDTHCWYHEKFPDYPAQRKILVPFVW
jgi:3-oxo-5-alpha-steroid 4-dehydrogenase 1